MTVGNVNIDYKQIIMSILFFLAGWVWNMNTEFKVGVAKQKELKEDVEFLFKEEDKTKEKNAKFWEDEAKYWRGKYVDLLESKIKDRD